MKKNLEISLLKNKKMNADTYVLRRKVIDCLYELKKVVDFPRIDVRVTEKNERCLGAAHMKIKAIWITETAISLSHEDLFAVVAHEVLHTAFGVGHDENCPLMSSHKKPITKVETIERFRVWARG